MKIKKFDVFLALLSGLLAALSFPKFNLPFFIWISFIPLFFVILKYQPKQSFLLGMAGGFSYYALLIYWIPSVPAHYGDLSWPLSFLIYILLVVFLSLSWGLFCLFFSKIKQRFPQTIFILSPFLWVCFEYILTYIFTGFPWGLLGSSQFKNIPLIQMAAVTGVYGISWVIIFFQSMFLFSMKYRKRAPFFAALGLVILIHGAGFWSLKKTPAAGNAFKASVIQGNVSSDIYWDRISPGEIKNLFQRHLNLSQKCAEEGARFIVWPEFSVPLCFSCSEELYQDFQRKLYQFVQKSECTLLLGTNEIAESEAQTRYYNTALCLHPDLSISRYFKMHLVPFGEYTPYQSVFSFIQKMTHAIGDITPGREHTLHRYKSHPFGSPICYEIIFPDLVRKFVKKGAHFLVTITNDGWYGKSSAPHQHFGMAVLRAVENRRFLLRAATTGISGIIDPYGRIIAQSELMTQTYLTDQITPFQKLTVYTRYGDLFSFVCLTSAGIFLILVLTKKIDERK